MTKLTNKQSQEIQTEYDVDSFYKKYIITALWSSTDDNENPLDDNYTDENIDLGTLKKMLDDCYNFIFQADKIEGFKNLDIETCGHDFWLTRNRHGCGFWDGDYEEKIGEKLTELSKKFNECDLYVGDDQKIYSL